MDPQQRGGSGPLVAVVSRKSMKFCTLNAVTTVQTLFLACGMLDVLIKLEETNKKGTSPVASFKLQNLREGNKVSA